MLARFQSGEDASALDLIRREWGYMLQNGPRTTMWELIGPYGSPPPNSYPSYDHGWSSGAAPALTSYILGVTPAAPGFSSFLAEPHLGDLAWVHGTVPTPHGAIEFNWGLYDGKLTAKIVSPVPGTVVLPVTGITRVDGREIPAEHGKTTVKVSAGTHEIVVRIA